MATPARTQPLSATPPTETLEGPEDALFMMMDGLTQEPATGRLLRGFTPFLDENGARHVFLLTERRRLEPWSGSAEPVAYQELVHWERAPGGGIYRGVCGKGTLLEREEVSAEFRARPLELIDWAAARMEAAVISSARPLMLQVHHVDKPWGREAWYTGIEKRGVSRVRAESGSTELPYAIGMFPVPLTGEQEPELVLLKTLEPRPEPVLGDLYLEVHRKKWETYLVLAVNREAWPTGVGYLRAGLDQGMIERYRKSHGARAESAMQKALLEKITAYEIVRREIDGIIDEKLKKSGRKTARAIPPERRLEIAASLPAALRKREATLRAEAEAFLGRHPMREGDVACLPPGVLHSLQHGVKVAEFQTPTYERLIAMFAQKVVTQHHWDTKQALAEMEKKPYTPPKTTPIPTEAKGVILDRVVDFPRFEVVRARLTGPAVWREPVEEPPAYRLLMVTEGTARLKLEDGSEYTMTKGEACLLPAALRGLSLAGKGKKPLTCLTARPKPAPGP